MRHVPPNSCSSLWYRLHGIKSWWNQFIKRFLIWVNFLPRIKQRQYTVCIFCTIWAKIKKKLQWTLYSFLFILWYESHFHMTLRMISLTSLCLSGSISLGRSKPTGYFIYAIVPTASPQITGYSKSVTLTDLPLGYYRKSTQFTSPLRLLDSPRPASRRTVAPIGIISYLFDFARSGFCLFGGARRNEPRLQL